MIATSQGPIVALDPVIRSHLEAFRRRRRRLIVERGVCAAAAALLASAAAVAALDRAFLIEDGARLALSVFVYATVLAALWFLCVRRLRRPLDERELARLIEHVRPELREDLLSAVELARGGPEREWDSAVFRALLQRDVSRRLEGVATKTLLPHALVRRWAWLAALAALATLALSLLPGLHYRRLLARALAPGADIERVSRTHIRIARPSPPDGLALAGEDVSVEVEVSGAPADEIRLDAWDGGGPRSRVRMKPIGGRRFAADVQPRSGRLVYRVRGGDAVTRRHVLTAVPPPRVVEFRKTYRHPAYTGRPDLAVTETSGDLDGLEGTVVDLELRVEPAVRRAELRIDAGGATNVVAARRVDDRTWRAEVRLRAPGTYQARLVALDTGFENRLAPRHEIRVQADLVPTVEIVEPTTVGAVDPAGSLALQALARDDLALASVEQVVQVNGRGWAAAGEAMCVTGAEARVDRRWELIDLGLKPGDRVMTKFVVTDLKGNRGETPPLRFAVAPEGEDAAERRALQAARRAREALRELAAAAAGARRTAGGVHAEISRSPPTDAQRRQAMARLGAAVDAVQARADRAREEIRRAIETVRAGDVARDLALAGRALSAIDRDALAAARGAWASDPADAPDPSGPGRAVEKLREVSELADRLGGDFDRLLAAREGRATQPRLERLAREQADLARLAGEATDDAARREQTMARASAAVDRADELRAQWEALRPLAPPASEPVRRLSEELDRALAAARKNVARTPDGSLPEGAVDPAAARAARDGLVRAGAALAPIAARLDELGRAAREDLERMAGRSAESVARARERAEKAELAAGRSGERLDRAVAETREALDAAAARLRDRAALEERRRDGDPRFPKDLDRTADVLESLARNASAEPPAGTLEAVRDVEQAFARIEAGHDVGEVARASAALAAEERWGAAGAARRRAEAWREIEQAAPGAAKESQKAGLPTAVGEAIARAARSGEARQVHDEMQARAQEGREARPVPEPAAKVAQGLDEARAAAQAAVEESRAAIAQRAPSLGEKLAALHEAAREMRGRTEAQAAGAADRPEPESRSASDDLLSRQETLNDRVDAARDSIRRDAAAQDLATPEGRERARDADDAIAMLRQAPPRAEDLLREAAAATDAASRGEKLRAATVPQARTEEALGLLAGHYAGLDRGEAEPTRDELRAAESEIGLRNALDDQYRRAEILAEAAARDSAPTIEALERELASNAPMRQELARIAGDTAQRAAGDLQRAHAREQQIAGTTDRLAGEQADAAAALARSAQLLAERAAETARAQAEPAARAVAEAGRPEARPPLEKAADLLRQAARDIPRDLSGEKGALGRQMAEAGQSLRQASDQAAKGQALAQADAPAPAPPPSAAAAEQAGATAQSARQLAAEADAIASRLNQMAARGAAEQGRLAGEQTPVAESTARAGADLARAGRHGERLGNETGDELQQLGARTEATARGEMRAAGEALATAPQAAAAAPAVAAARDEIGRRVQEMEAMKGAMTAPAAPSSDSGEAADAAGPWMARALDQLDAARAAASAEAMPSPSAPAQQAMSQAAQAQAQAMASSRIAASRAPPSEGQAAQRAGTAGGEAVDGPRAGAGDPDWAKLPPKVARDLMDARREAVPEEYRPMVEAYFERLATEMQK